MVGTMQNCEDLVSVMEQTTQQVSRGLIYWELEHGGR
jgi:hypothetical protein